MGASSVAVADLNGDSLPDLTIGGLSEVEVRLGTGAGAFGPRTVYNWGSNPLAVAVDDLSGDGIPDLVAANYDVGTVSVLLGDGTGAFGTRTDFAVATRPAQVVIADLNGDTFADVVTANFTSQSVSVLLGSGSGSFAPKTDYTVGVNPRSVAVADLNGDGIPDLTTANYSSDSVSVLLGNGDGGFAPKADHPVDAAPVSIAAADLNGDSRPDLAVGSTTADTVSVLLNTTTPPVVSIGSASGLERDLVTGSVFVPVFLSKANDAPTVVSFYTVNGTATAGSDFARWGTPAKPRTITIPAGALQGTINVPVAADAVVEPDETFSVVLSSVSGGGAVIGADTGTATIIDADAVSATNPAISVSSGTVVEGDSGQRRAQFLIHLSRPPATKLTVSYATADGTAVAGEDYRAKLPGTVVFAPGQISKTVDVLVNSNTDADGPRDFALDVTVTGGFPIEEITMTGVATILDDDGGAAVP